MYCLSLQNSISSPLLMDMSGYSAPLVVKVGTILSLSDKLIPYMLGCFKETEKNIFAVSFFFMPKWYNWLKSLLTDLSSLHFAW